MDVITIIILIAIALLVFGAVTGIIQARRRYLAQKALMQFPPMSLPAKQYPSKQPTHTSFHPAPTLPTENPIQQNLFKPIGPLPANQPPPQLQVQRSRNASTTQGFSGRGPDKTLTGTCFLTGKPRTSCNCNSCRAERGLGDKQ